MQVIVLGTQKAAIFQINPHHVNFKEGFVIHACLCSGLVFLTATPSILEITF